MKKFLSSLLLIPSLLFGAPGDIVSVTIPAEGSWCDIVIEGLSDGGLYEHGFGTNKDPETGTGAKITFAVTSEGYTGTTLGTTLRTVYGMVPAHTPYSTSTIAAASRTGSFAEGETITQAVTGATAVVLIPSSAGPRLFVRSVAGGAADASNVWSGASGTLTPSATPATYYYSYREYEDGTNLTVRLSLSEPIYADDESGVNKSGVDVTCSILGGFYTEAGGDGGTPNNATTSAFAVTNNSTLGYPGGANGHVAGKWDSIGGVRHCDRVAGDYDVAFNARAGWGVAAVRFDALGLNSGATDTETVTTITQTRRSGSGLYLTHHKTTLNVAGFTSGERIELRARVYPKVGDADSVFDTNSYTTVADEVMERNKSIINYNTTVKYAYVALASDSPAGNDGTGVASTTEATAAASPFLSIGKAIQNDATVIKLRTGTHPAVGTASSTRRTTNEWYVVQPAAGATSTIQLNATERSYKCERLQFYGVGVTLAGTTSWLSGDAAGNFIRFTSSNFDSSGVGTPSVGPGYESLACYFENCTGDLGAEGWHLGGSGVSRNAYTFDGCVLTQTATSPVIGPWYRFTANRTTGNVWLSAKTSSNPAPTNLSCMVENNLFYGQGLNAVGLTLFFDTLSSPTELACVQGNIWERITSGNPPLHYAGDARTVNCNGGIIVNNTSVGDRWNYSYNDNSDGSLRTLTNLFSRNNISSSLATKHDFFGTPSGNRVGGYWGLYGVGHSGNFWAMTTGINSSGQFPFVNPGIRSYQPTLTTAYPPGSVANNTALTFPQFVGYAAYSGSTGAGNGDYRLHTGSPAFRLAKGGREPFFPYDLFGRPRSRNSEAAGAIAEGGNRQASMFFAN